MKNSFFLLLISLFLGKSFACSKEYPNDGDKQALKALLQSAYFERLYAKTYYSLLDRLEPDGYLPESLTGAYEGMFPRTSGPLVFLFMETGRLQEAENNIRCVLKAIGDNGMERIPRVIGKRDDHYLILDDQHQIDGQMHVILAWAQLALLRGHTAFEEETWPQVRDIMQRTFDRTFFQYGTWSIEPGLIRNIAFEHSKESRMWDVWDLLTQSFGGACLRDMALVAERRGDQTFAQEWKKKEAVLKAGIQKHMVSKHEGKSTYVELFLPNSNGGTPYYGFGWVTLSPVAAGWEGADRQVLRNTVDLMESRFLKHTNGVAWMPTDGYPDGRFSNEIIGKGMGWEMEFGREEERYGRILEILNLLKTVNADHPIYMEGAWLEGNGFTLSNILSAQDLEKMKTSVWKVKDAGNGEQTAWWCWAMARLRKSLGLSAAPDRKYL